MSISTALALDLMVRWHWRGGGLVLKGVAKVGERESGKRRGLVCRGVGWDLGEGILRNCREDSLLHL